MKRIAGITIILIFLIVTCWAQSGSDMSAPQLKSQHARHSEVAGISTQVQLISKETGPVAKNRKGWNKSDPTVIKVNQESIQESESTQNTKAKAVSGKVILPFVLIILLVL